MARGGKTEEMIALLAFGRRIGTDDPFEYLVATRGWERDAWTPTFIDACDPSDIDVSDVADRAKPPRSKQVLRPPGAAREPCCEASRDAAARLMVASTTELPTLYFVEWHYIDFVLSCVGNVSEAARILGIRRSTVQRKRKKQPPGK
jgi:hypothetical protein